MGKEIDVYIDKELLIVISVVFIEKCDICNMMVYEFVGLGCSLYIDFWGIFCGEDKEVVECFIVLVKI